MSDLVAELLLRVAKVVLVTVLGGILYLVVTGPLGEPGSVTLALLCWLTAAGSWLLAQTSPL